jgi:hypothetical protein
MEGNRQAALKAYDKTGRTLGDTVANVVIFIDGITVKRGYGRVEIQIQSLKHRRAPKAGFRF